MSLSHLVRPELVFPRMRAEGRDELLRELSRRLEEAGWVRRAGKLLALLLEREGLGSTALGKGIAVPHCKMAGLERTVLAVATCPDGVDFEAEDGRPASLIFLLVSPATSPADHLRALAAISAWVKAHPDLHDLLALSDAGAIAQELQDDHAHDERDP